MKANAQFVSLPSVKCFNVNKYEHRTGMILVFYYFYQTFWICVFINSNVNGLMWKYLNYQLFFWMVYTVWANNANCQMLVNLKLHCNKTNSLFRTQVHVKIFIFIISRLICISCSHINTELYSPKWHWSVSHLCLCENFAEKVHFWHFVMIPLNIYKDCD